jgi:predicted nucleotidyltransferase component of viral defense system
MDEADYTGIRVSMETRFDGVVTPFKIDISTGDIITPKAVRYQLHLMLEARSVDIWAYNLETIFAEKLETIISRNTTNTRMRDFYDIYSLLQLYGENLNVEILKNALLATAKKRGSDYHLKDVYEILDEVKNSQVMVKLWQAYQKKFSYAADISWENVMKAVRYCMQMINIG